MTASRPYAPLHRRPFEPSDLAPPAAYWEREDAIQAQQLAARDLVLEHLGTPGAFQVLADRTRLEPGPLMAALHVLREDGVVTCERGVFWRASAPSSTVLDLASPPAAVG